jgi:hypothetical protein
MSYTLRGRLESRIAALLPVILAACALGAGMHRWWPIELAALMAVVGVALDIQLYDRLLAYQPGWATLPLGLLELALLMAVARLSGLDVPLWPALALFGAGWLVAQALGHAGFPLLRVSYAEDGGELGRTGALAALAVVGTIAAAGVIAWIARPPTVHLAAGVHQGPLVITHRQILVGRPGAVVRGGIVVRASGVTIRNITVVGGENGIEVDGVHDVRLENVSVSGAQLDGIHVRRAGVVISGCDVDSMGNEFAQGIDISYAFDKEESSVMGCRVVGGQEGIVTHFANAMIAHNTVSGTRLRGISMTEMSMGMIEHNDVRDALGVGIFCNDHSMCMLEKNTVVDTRPDISGDLWRAGFGVLASYNSEAELKDNVLVANPRPAGAMLNSRLVER